jgi:hypothetical protein
MSMPALIGSKQLICHSGGVIFDLGDHNEFRSTRNSGDQRQISGIPPHDLYKKYSLMRGSRDLNAIDCFQGNIQSRINAYGKICPEYIVVNRGSNANHRESSLCEGKGPSLRSIAANHDQSGNLVCPEDGHRFCLGLLFHESG